MKLKILLIILLSTVTIFAQTNPGGVELSISTIGGSFNGSVKSGGNTYNIDTQKYIVLAFRSGVYLLGGFELEPEFMMTASDADQPVFNIAANAAYNIIIPQSNIMPFILAGYGIGNSIPLFNELVGKRASKKLDIGNLNIGGGLKIFVSKSAAIRIEYRYQSFKYNTEFTDWSGTTYKTEFTTNANKVLLGFSIFL